MRKLLIAAPAFVAGCLLTASLTTVARAKGPAPVKTHDYLAVTDEESLRKAGMKGYGIVATDISGNGVMYWTLERK